MFGKKEDGDKDDILDRYEDSPNTRVETVIKDIEFCSIGACRIATLDYIEKHDDVFSLKSRHMFSGASQRFIRLAIEESDPEFKKDKSSLITAWNDQEGRTKGEVLAVFRRAIELSKAAT